MEEEGRKERGSRGGAEGEVAGASERGEPTARMVAKLPGGGAGERGTGRQEGRTRAVFMPCRSRPMLLLFKWMVPREKSSPWAHGHCPLPFTCARVSQHRAILHLPTPTNRPSFALAAFASSGDEGHFARVPRGYLANEVE